MMQHIKGNALDWADKDGYCMIHVCNNKGGFGGGKTAIATQVAERFPYVKEQYMKHYSNEGESCGDLEKVVNLIAQDGYGARWKGVKYFREDWFESSLRYTIDAGFNCYTESEQNDHGIHTIVVPYKMGADRAGGDWSWIIAKVEEVLGDNFEILVVEYDG